MSGGTFTLDTSGYVPLPSHHGGQVQFRWGGLTPFTQGYIEAAFRSFVEIMDAGRREDGQYVSSTEDYGFSNIAKGTLAAILKDCAAYDEATSGYPASKSRAFALTALQGQAFWTRRQAGDLRSFPPLTPYLGEDGLIYLREVQS